MAHTPGPWYWEKDKQDIRLYTPKNGYCIVMDFVRRGRQGAQPRFSDRGDAPLGGILHKAEDIDLSQNPDARLIQYAPDLLESCKKMVEAFENAEMNFPGEYEDFITIDNMQDALDQARAALAKVEG
jgi:hypothetical protein